jgi:hypothetical protein
MDLWKIALAASIILGLSFLPFLSGSLSIAEGSQRDSIKFFQVTEGAYSYEDMKPVFDGKYAGVNSDQAVIGDMMIDSSQYGLTSDNNGCFTNPKVSIDGEEVDKYSLNSAIYEYTSWTDDESSSQEYRSQTFDNGISAVFANPFYMETDVYWGYFQGIESCHGPFNRYEMPVDFDSISNTVEAPETVSEGESFTVDYRFENGWRPLKTNVSTQVCIGDLCRTVEKTGQEVPVGGRTVSLSITPETSGEVSIDADGVVGLDTSSMRFEGVSTDVDGDGDMENPNNHGMIKIGEIEGSQVVDVVPRLESLSLEDLRYNILRWLDFWLPGEVF